MIVKQKFPTEFQIQLVVELVDTLKDSCCLFLQISFIVKTCFCCHVTYVLFHYDYNLVPSFL